MTWSICPCAHILDLKCQIQKSIPYLPLTTSMCFIYLVYMWRKRGSSYLEIFKPWVYWQRDRTGQDRPLSGFKICWLRVNRKLILFSATFSQINNKACGKVTIPLQATKDSELVRQLVLQSPLGQKLLAGCFIKRAILSPRTALINFLIDEWCLHCLVQCWLPLPGVFLAECHSLSVHISRYFYLNVFFQ